MTFPTACTRARRVVGPAATALFVLAAPALAQEQLGRSMISLTASPAFETWSFGDGGLPQPPIGGGTNVFLSKATQISVPLVLTIPFGMDRWKLDISSGFASSKVQLAAPDNALQTSSYSLSGITDTKIRLSAKPAGDNILLTVGLNAPSGKTELDGEELSALRVIAAPALGFQIPHYGTGGGGTVGAVYAREFNDWAWAVGASYELRSGYTPISFSGGIPSPDFNPGDVIHLSIGGDGVLGNHGMSVGVSADIFSEDELDSQGTAQPGTQLGPIITAEWRLRFAAPRFQELSLSFVDRFRTGFKRNGQTVDGSDGNYLDVALLAAHALSPGTNMAWELNVRHHTGLNADSAITSAATSGAGLRVSVSRALRGGALLQPFARVHFATIENGNSSASATGFGVGLTVLKGW